MFRFLHYATNPPLIWNKGGIAPSIKTNIVLICLVTSLAWVGCEGYRDAVRGMGSDMGAIQTRDIQQADAYRKFSSSLGPERPTSPSGTSLPRPSANVLPRNWQISTARIHS
jgi:hypothetical protein